MITSFTGIVVGVDGSDESRTHLNSLFDQARNQCEPVRVVTAYQSPRYGALPGGMPMSVTEQEIAQRVRSRPSR